MGRLAPLALLSLALLLAAPPAGAQGPGRAGVVVAYGDGSVQTACVELGAAPLDGVELLERAGLSPTLQQGGIGAAVCKIGPDGCDYPAEPCFCERDGPRSIYWAFYTLREGAWAYAALGAGNTTVADGDLHGWAWGLGDSASGALPPDLTFAEVCPAPAATAAPPTAPPAAAATGGPTAAPPTAAPAPPTATPAAPTPAAPASGAGGGLAAFAALALVLGAAAALIVSRRRPPAGQ